MTCMLSEKPIWGGPKTYLGKVTRLLAEHESFLWIMVWWWDSKDQISKQRHNIVSIQIILCIYLMLYNWQSISYLSYYAASPHDNPYVGIFNAHFKVQGC